MGTGETLQRGEKFFKGELKRELKWELKGELKRELKGRM